MWEEKAFHVVMSIGKYSVLGVVAVGGLLWQYQNKLIYPANMPAGSREVVPEPPQFGMPKFEHVELEAPDGTKLRSFLLLQGAEEGQIEQKAPARPTVILLHANAGNVGHRLPIAKVFYQNIKANVFMLSYRGYGKSEGSPSEAGIRSDAQTALDYVLSHPQLEKTKIVLYGQSLGGAVAIDLAQRNQQRVHGVVVENTFWSLPELVPHIMPYAKPFLMLLHQKWESGKLIATMDKDLPFLFLSGEEDELVPPQHVEALYESCTSEVKLLKKFATGTHNDTCVQPGYFEIIAHFLSTRVLGEKGYPGQKPDEEEKPDAAGPDVLDEETLREHLDEDLREMGAEAGSRVLPPHVESS